MARSYNEGMKCVIGITAALCGFCAWGQSTLEVSGQTIRLGEPKAVSVTVENVDWEPAGKALLYEGTDADGSFQGIFRTDKLQGKVVLRNPKETVTRHRGWLAKRPVMFQVFSVQNKTRKVLRLWMVVIDATTLTAKEVWSSEFPLGEQIGVEVMQSPCRDHAIVTVTDRKGAHPYVIVDGSNVVLAAPDIAQAQKEGAGFAGWSADGTAYYQRGGQPETFRARQSDGNDVVITLGQKGELQAGQAIEFVASGDAKEKLITGVSFALKILAAPVAPPAGTAVFEVMPWNGRMRSVRSRGPFIDKPLDPAPVDPRPERARVISGSRQGPSRALWLLPAGLKPEDAFSPLALLVAADAERFWISDNKGWVAWTTGGALFVRQIVTR